MWLCDSHQCQVQDQIVALSRKHKAAGKKFAEVRFDNAVGLIDINKQHWQVVTEFNRDLTTRTAGRMSPRGCHGKRLKAAVPQRHRRPECDSLGTDRQPVRGILDVAAAHDLAGLGQ